MKRRGRHQLQINVCEGFTRAVCTFSLELVRGSRNGDCHNVTASQLKIEGSLGIEEGRR